MKEKLINLNSDFYEPELILNVFAFNNILNSGTSQIQIRFE